MRDARSGTRLTGSALPLFVVLHGRVEGTEVHLPEERADLARLVPSGVEPRLDAGVDLGQKLDGLAQGPYQLFLWHLIEGVGQLLEFADLPLEASQIVLLHPTILHKSPTIHYQAVDAVLRSFRHPVYGLDQITYHLFGGAVLFGPLFDEVFQEDRVYPPDGGEDGVGLLDDVGVGYVALLDHLLDSPDMALHTLEPAYHLAPRLLLQTLRYLPLVSISSSSSLTTVASWKGTSPPGRCWTVSCPLPATTTTSPSRASSSARLMAVCRSSSTHVREGSAPASTSPAIFRGSSEYASSVVMMLTSANLEATRPILGRLAPSLSPAAPNTQTTRPCPTSATPRATCRTASNPTSVWA